MHHGADVNYAENSSKSTISKYQSFGSHCCFWLFWTVGWAPIHYAAQNNMLALARVLIKGGADACARSHGMLMHILPFYRLARVLRRQCTGRYGLDALAIAAERHNVRMAKLLVHLGGCDPKSSITSSAYLPLHGAKTNAHTCYVIALAGGTSSWDLLPGMRGEVQHLDFA